ncbi:hypothetical protein B0I37DRAFT_354350 [Chaetomium sp. MPI-CAGE-AT-0009]|nr:hypothetical protein B0I37DRAFT_354350 [Chaetomium sp. MPI-CAGE-AT-0009]
MAQVAAAAIAAEQVVATGVEAAAAVAIAAPTLPLKIALTHLPNPAPEGSPHPALSRSHHTLTVLRNKAYIFGGLDPSRKLCAPGIHTITLPSSPTATDPASAAATTTTPSSTDNHTTTTTTDYGTAYTCYPPFSLQDEATGETLVPAARAGHAACARGIAMCWCTAGGGGCPGAGGGGGGCIWQWDCEGLRWGKLRGDSQLGVGPMRARWGHWMFADGGQGFLVVVGGRTGGEGGGEVEREAWMYDLESMVWTVLPSMPATPLAAAYAAGRVYVISRDGDGGSGLGGVVHYLDMKESVTERARPGALVWESVSFPANPLAPGPKPRAGGALVPLSTGHGREYLVYLFGCSQEEGAEREYFSDIWTLQLPAHGRSAAAVKDKIREKLPRMESGAFRWAEAEIVPTEQMTGEGKMHPGPRGLFAADSCFDGQGVVLWGGTNAKGEEEGDGWVLRLAHGYADNDRWE